MKRWFIGKLYLWQNAVNAYGKEKKIAALKSLPGVLIKAPYFIGNQSDFFY